MAGSALLLSSQAVNVLVVSLFWAADAAWRLVLGRHLMGGTEYLWEERFPLWLRLLSLYHLALPVVLLWALRRTGYDARGWKLQAGMAAVAMVAARLLEPVENYNMVYRDPFLAAVGPGDGPYGVHVGDADRGGRRPRTGARPSLWAGRAARPMRGLSVTSHPPPFAVL